MFPGGLSGCAGCSCCPARSLDVSRFYMLLPLLPMYLLSFAMGCAIGDKSSLMLLSFINVRNYERREDVNNAQDTVYCAFLKVQKADLQCVGGIAVGRQRAALGSNAFLLSVSSQCVPLGRDMSSNAFSPCFPLDSYLIQCPCLHPHRAHRLVCAAW